MKFAALIASMLGGRRDMIEGLMVQRKGMKNMLL
jgi:hypothetical protein